MPFIFQVSIKGDLVGIVGVAGAMVNNSRIGILFGCFVRVVRFACSKKPIVGRTKKGIDLGSSSCEDYWTM